MTSYRSFLSSLIDLLLYNMQRALLSKIQLMEKELGRRLGLKARWSPRHIVKIVSLIAPPFCFNSSCTYD
jgi:hypothetical protein